MKKLFKKKKKSIFDGIKFRIRYDPNLDKYKDVVLFPKKLAEANRILKDTKFPENFFDVTKQSE
jgi:hypothetical protein